MGLIGRMCTTKVMHVGIFLMFRKMESIILMRALKQVLQEVFKKKVTLKCSLTSLGRTKKAQLNFLPKIN